MNAYELANTILKTTDMQVYAQSVTKATNMLRQQADRIAELEKKLKRTKFAWNLAENEIERLSNKDKSGNSISAEEYQKTHEGFSTIQEVIAKHEAIPSRKEAIDKAREWLKDYCIEAVFDKPQTKRLSDEEKKEITKQYLRSHLLYVVTEEVVDDFQLAGAIVEEFDFRKDESWIDKEKLKQALEWDAKQRQPMQILEDGRIIPVFKELTNEEIWEVWESCTCSLYDITGFAKAILRKAQEK